MNKLATLGAIILLCVNGFCSPVSAKDRSEIILAGGCFWGTEHFLKQIKGVENTEVGSANGKGEATINGVVQKGTGYAEVVRVHYNPQVVSLDKILKLYFMTIDPTSLNKQGADEGVGYRTGIYYTNKDDLPVIESLINELAKEHTKPIVIEVMPLKNYHTAEEKHQDYLDKNKDGYCRIDPKLFDFVKANSK